MANKITEEVFLKDLEDFKFRNQVEVLISFSEFKNVKTKMPVRCLVCGEEYLKEYYVLRKGVGIRSALLKELLSKEQHKELEKEMILRR